MFICVYTWACDVKCSQTSGSCQNTMENTSLEGL